MELRHSSFARAVFDCAITFTHVSACETRCDAPARHGCQLVSRVREPGAAPHIPLPRVQCSRMVAVYNTFGDAEAAKPQAGYKKYSKYSPLQSFDAIMPSHLEVSPPDLLIDSSQLLLLEPRGSPWLLLRC